MTDHVTGWGRHLLLVLGNRSKCFFLAELVGDLAPRGLAEWCAIVAAAPRNGVKLGADEHGYGGAGHYTNFRLVQDALHACPALGA